MENDSLIVRINFIVNGAERTVSVEPRELLLETLRDKLNLTGAKYGCGEAVCGACTVLLDGKPVCSCNMLSVEADGRDILTIEGLSQGKESLDPIQRAFVEFDGLQCGYCTSGQVLSAKSFIDSFSELHAVPNNDILNSSIKEAMSGNLCRCGCYNGITEAIKSALSQKNLKEEFV